MNSWGALSQKCNIFMHQTSYSDSRKILNSYDGSTLTLQIGPTFSFVSEKLFELTKYQFLENNEKNTI